MRFGEDEEDIEFLLRQCGITNAAEALALLARLYPHKELPGALPVVPGWFPSFPTACWIRADPWCRRTGRVPASGRLFGHGRLAPTIASTMWRGIALPAPLPPLTSTICRRRAGFSGRPNARRPHRHPGQP